ncbi:hypothetical protein INS49_013660 [Diaporthe citri]|uniref:uncharacterized protein n=1 Tax=Diaporthe citri TaxID=83186 RepID=UPI001C81952F|nr:uncharacterized protein INS49_013660 [Diaporthe citri]KAG6357781.1 hypothetical protein INS49_013660 [Diaporthe citri]
MKTTTLITAALVAFTPLVQADNCTPGLNYCGYGLLRKGNYYNQINAALLTNRQSTDSNHINQSLFMCIGGNNGDISFIKYCGTCQDGGSGRSDHC